MTVPAAATRPPAPSTSLAAPKVLLHDHLDGGLRPSTLVELADGIGHELPSTDADELAAWFVASAASGSLVRYLETFSHTVAVLQREDALERVAAEAVLDLAADGVVYAEIRYAPELCTGGGLALEAVVEAVQAGYARGVTEAAEAGHRIGVGTLIDAMRQADNHMAAARLAVRYRDAGVVGFDIAGPEDGFPATRQAEAFDLLRAEHVPFTVHAGEAAGLDSIEGALAVGALRLGHGVRVADDVVAADAPGGAPQLGRVATWVRDRRIALEASPTSNIHTGVAPGYAGAPVEPAQGPRLRRHRQHRQPARVRHVDEQRDDAAARAGRLERRRPRPGQRGRGRGDVPAAAASARSSCCGCATAGRRWPPEATGARAAGTARAS